MRVRGEVGGVRRTVCPTAIYVCADWGGKQEVEVVLTATIDAMTADALNTGREVRVDLLMNRHWFRADCVFPCDSYSRISWCCVWRMARISMLRPLLSTPGPASVSPSRVLWIFRHCPLITKWSGMSLEQLVCAIEPVRNIPVPALNPSDTFDPADETKQPPPQLSIPKELWRLVDTLWQGEGMREKDLLASSSEPGEVRTTLGQPGGCS